MGNYTDFIDWGTSIIHGEYTHTYNVINNTTFKHTSGGSQTIGSNYWYLSDNILEPKNSLFENAEEYGEDE